jgi:hypothetical protein
MTTHRRYSFVHPGPQDGHDVVIRVLREACDTYWWYQEPHVEGQPFGRLSFSFTVSGRDQWWTHRRAMSLAVDCYYALGMDERKVPEPEWEALAPHTNRGRYRLVYTPPQGYSEADPNEGM